jgi:hypothetical protein
VLLVELPVVVLVVELTVVLLLVVELTVVLLVVVAIVVVVEVVEVELRSSIRERKFAFCASFSFS